MIRKRLLSACLALALCLGLLPVTALAAEGAPGSLYVAGQQITDEGYYTQSGGNWTKSDATSTPPSAPYFHYTKGNDNTPATLTLSGATIQGGTSTGSVPYGAGIYAQCNSGESVSLTIELIGENTITGYYGIYVNAELSANSYGTDASLNITGNGSLIVTGTNSHGLFVKSGTGNASLNIKNVAVTSSTNGDYAAGVYVMSSMYATNSPKISLSVDGGSLTASGTGSNDGILFYVGLSQATGATTRLTVSENAIVDARNGGIKATRVSTVLPTPTPTGENSSGIVFDGTEGTVYGNVELQKDLEIKSGETLTVPDGSKLDCNEKLTNNGTINVEDGGTVSGNLSGGTEVTTPSITAQPTDQTVTEGQSATFTVEASAGSETPTYQWQQKTAASGSDWTDISQETASYTISSTTTSMSGNQYRCVVKSASGVSVISQAATLTVNQSVTPTSYSISADVAPAGAGTVTVNGSGTSASVAAGSEVTLTATANDGYRFTGWMENDQRVSTDATYTFKATGDRTLTAKFEKKVTGVTLDKTTLELFTGDTETLTATVAPDNATNKNVTWSTSDANVATVENGVVTAVSAGTATITVTTEDGAKTATCTVTVSRYSTGGGPTTYAVTAPDAENGTVRVSPSRASRGTTVTITVTPDEGYELESLTVLDSRDNEITLTDKGDGKYTFTMPSGRVTVEASFAEIAPEPLPFGDVDDGDWFAGAVRFVYESGMMNGVSETDFAPHATTSRSMIVTILYRLEGEPVVDDAMDFNDVAGDAYYAEAVRWAASEGIVGGYGGGLFGSDDAVTREQLAVILYRYAVYKGYDVSIGEDTNILSYDDFADLSEYAIPAMQWACGAGIITGVTDSTLVPQGTATRAQCAAMLMRFVEANS